MPPCKRDDRPRPNAALRANASPPCSNARVFNRTNSPKKVSFNQKTVSYWGRRAVTLKSEQNKAVCAALGYAHEEILGLTAPKVRSYGPDGKVKAVFDRVSALPHDLQKKDSRCRRGHACRLRTPAKPVNAMNPAEALPILRAQADGRDPSSGAPLGAQSVFQRPEVIRALFAAVLALDTPHSSADVAPDFRLGKPMDK